MKVRIMLSFWGGGAVVSDVSSANHEVNDKSTKHACVPCVHVFA